LNTARIIVVFPYHERWRDRPEEASATTVKLAAGANSGRQSDYERKPG